MLKFTIEKPNAKHAYLINATNDKAVYEIHRTAEIIVHANNRTQAAAMVKRQGFEVSDVNMIG